MNSTVNLDKRMKENNFLEVIRIYISPGHAYWSKGLPQPSDCSLVEVPEVQCLAGRGLRGDRYANKETGRVGQVTFISETAIQEVREAFDLPGLSDTLFRRNIVVRGVELATLLDQPFEIQGVLFEGSQECKPCQWMDRMIAPGAQKFLQQNFRGGLRAKILCDGVLKSAPSTRR